MDERAERATSDATLLARQTQAQRGSTLCPLAGLLCGEGLRRVGLLLDLDDRAGLLELLLDVLGLVLGHALLHRVGSLVDQVLGLLEAQAGQRADDLDHLDLLVADTGQDDIELGLLLDLYGTTT